MTVAGFRLLPGRLDAAAQRALADEVLALAGQAPPYRPVTPGGKPMSVAMTNLGPLGWVTDARRLSLRADAIRSPARPGRRSRRR